jgi:hypothetical protein
LRNWEEVPPATFSYKFGKVIVPLTGLYTVPFKEILPPPIIVPFFHCEVAESYISVCPLAGEVIVTSSNPARVVTDGWVSPKPYALISPTLKKS